MNLTRKKTLLLWTVLAAVLEGYSATGIEVTDAYAKLARERIDAAVGAAA